MSLMNTSRSRTILQPRPQHQQTSQYISQPTLAVFDSANRPVTPYNIDANGLDLDFDADRSCQSLSASPISTQSLLSQYSGVSTTPLSTFDSIPTITVPRVTQDGSLFDFSQGNQADFGDPWLANSNMMQTETWLSTGQLTPRSTGRVSHHRESSLSSLGSTTGPASPYSQNTSNPHIAVESMVDGFHGLPNTDELNYQLAKFPGISHDTFYQNYPAYAPADTQITGYPNLAATPKRRTDRGLLLPEVPIGPSRSRPLSVASTITTGDSPATPSAEPEDDGRQKHVVTVPKLDRTMTDVYSDELYSPNFTITSTASGQVPKSPNDLFARTLQAANSQHLGVGQQSPVSASSTRDRSPFRQGSPLAPIPMHDFSSMASPQARFPSAQQIREQNKAEMDARALQQQMGRSTVNTSTPQTISPQEALLEFHDADTESNFPLFPQQSSNSYDASVTSKPLANSQAFEPLQLDTASLNNYINSQIQPTGLQMPQIPQQYPFISQARHQSSVPSLSNGSLAASRMGSSEVGTADSSHTGSPQRPAATSADGGTYTCTYHGCTLRFETPALLQKHKREGHRQAHGINGTRNSEVAALGMTSSLLNSQAGPHRCDRINPSTGKPCNTVFSRPYDLTRHEDTIHNARKQKVRCDLCTDEKTFSRADALTRHYRVCHPDVEFPGKQRRRGGQGG
ncbi:hypothetical protein B0H66DRAFT_481733 [Apodospora peruviana]|uniref:C2H2-type domain-containing protein n=1 Tax=Apodospora peruviana TaxID=516989 RepID=A0AAE0M257_9PEZI|nr:hypothetical protein B0H66DRAFT_481733 [Apodospora peruviana]